MSTQQQDVTLASDLVTIQVTKKGCYLKQSEYNAIKHDLFKRLLTKFGITISNKKYSQTGILVDICFYNWENFTHDISEEQQRIIKLANFTEGIDTISGAWLLNQDRFICHSIDNNEMPHPIVHISSIHSESELKSFFPRYTYIMDDSIWNYLLLLDRDITQTTNRFKDIIMQIKENAFQNKYYYLNIAYEYAHLKARIARESFILLNKGEIGNHGAHISPFLFHSENKMRNEVEKNMTKKKEIIRKYKWHFLLLDDKYNKALSLIPACKEKVIINKSQIFRKRLDNIIGQANYTLDSVALCSDALSKIKSGKSKYDVIFLDYLLEENHYGYEILNNIYKECDEAEKNEKPYPDYIGPAQRLFFMFTSAFTTAVSERLILEGLSRSKSYWHIGESACPTNTPHLFDYYLLDLMYKRLEDSGINSLSEDNILSKIKYIFEEVNSYNKNEDRIKAVRERAFDTYYEFLDLHHKYALLKKDKGQSRLVDSFLEDKVHMGAMLEHLLQLIHLTAFGTIRQWPEIWEEYKFFTRTFSHKNELDSEVVELSHNIEQYIITLKSA